MKPKPLTPEDIDALQTSGLSRETPFAIEGVSRGFFSIARFYGGAVYNGDHYTYFPGSDELVRDDVLVWLKKRKKKPHGKKQNDPR